MSNIDKRALREVAEKATKGPWKVFSDIDTKTFSIHTPRDKRCENVIKWGGFDCQPNAEANAEFIAAFNPKVALALLDDMQQAREQLAAAEQERENWRISFDNERYRADKLAAALNAEREKLVMANRSLITQHIRANSAESRIAELEAEKAELRPVGVMSEKAFYRLEQSDSRFIALWPRPGIHLPRKRPLDSVVVYARVVAAAGIGKGD
ncbi:ead/Ea22-like family protein [Salmonella enterica]|nr:ead/Ea22-like family protein [Salmonella enterica]